MKGGVYRMLTLFRTFTLIVKIIIALTVMGMLV